MSIPAFSYPKLVLHFGLPYELCHFGPFFANGAFYLFLGLGDTYANSVVRHGAGGATGFVTSNGFGYSTGTNIGTTRTAPQPGVGGGFTVNILAVDSEGSPTSLSINSAGSGYAVGDTGTINGGTVKCSYVVSVIGGGGSVVTFGIVSGLGYSVASGVATTRGGPQPGTGAGLTLNVDAINSSGSPTALSLSALGSGYLVGDTGTLNGGDEPASYVVTSVDNSSIETATCRFAVMKSTDAGVTWNELDPAHSPSFYQQFSVCDFADDGNDVGCFRSGDTIYFTFYPNTGSRDLRKNANISLGSFSLGTETYGAVVTGGPLVNDDPSIGYPYLPVRLSSGVLLVFYQKGTSADQVNWAQFSGGLWSNVDSLFAAAGSSTGKISFGGAVVDSSDRVLIPFIDTSEANPSMRVGQWAAGVVTVTNIRAGIGSPNFRFEIASFTGKPLYLSSRDEYVFGFRERYGPLGGFHDRIMLARGSPSAVPVWTFEAVEDPTFGESADDSPYFVVGNLAQTKLYLWADDNFTNPSGLLKVYEQDSVGSWNAPVIAYDDGPTPLAFPDRTLFGQNNTLCEFSITLINDTPLFAVSFGMEQVFPLSFPPFNTYEYNTQYFMINSTPIALACPNPPPVFGIPYSQPLVVTGGMPPFIFAIIAGALPPGLSLNTSTGVISGTWNVPIAYSYTAQVTDANGLQATTTCSGSPPGPPPPPPPPPPPGVCIVNPIATPTPSIVLYPEPLEKQGS